MAEPRSSSTDLRWGENMLSKSIMRLLYGSRIVNEIELYDRQKRIKGFSQEKVSGGTIGIIGVGATGSHSACYAAKVGVGYIKVCDPDVIELHNLPRLLGISRDYVGVNKAFALVELLKEVREDVRFCAYPHEFCEVEQQFCENLDAAIICVDRISTRFEIGEALWHRGIPHVDVGIRDLLCNVMVFLPDRKDWPCIFCARKIIPQSQIESSNTAKHCDDQPIPTIITPAAVGSGIAVNEILKILNGSELGEPLEHFIQIDLRSLTPFKIRIPKDPDCPVCGVVRN